MSPAPAANRAPASPEPQPWATPSSDLATSPGSATEGAEAQESADAVRSLESSLVTGGSLAAGQDATALAAALQPLARCDPDTLLGLDPRQGIPAPAQQLQGGDVLPAGGSDADDVPSPPVRPPAPARQFQGSDRLPVGVWDSDDVPSPPVRPPASPTPSPKPRPPDSVSPSPTPFDERETVSAEPAGDGKPSMDRRDDRMHVEQVSVLCSTSPVCSQCVGCAANAKYASRRRNVFC